MGVDLKQGPVLAALLMVVLLSGCGPAATLAPSPTLDRPSLSEGEAIAVVKSHLARVSTRGRNCLSLIQYMGNEGTWTAEYLGTGGVASQCYGTIFRRYPTVGGSLRPATALFVRATERVTTC